MAEWNHVMCDDCWEVKNPGRVPHRVAAEYPPEMETCCFCGDFTDSGIYVRKDPKEMECKHGNR